jgi:hypothetical protein
LKYRHFIGQSEHVFKKVYFLLSRRLENLVLNLAAPPCTIIQSSLRGGKITRPGLFGRRDNKKYLTTLP